MNLLARGFIFWLPYFLLGELPAIFWKGCPWPTFTGTIRIADRLVPGRVHRGGAVLDRALPAFREGLERLVAHRSGGDRRWPRRREVRPVVDGTTSLMTAMREV